MSVTVKDIAVLAKVSPATVSRVFNRHPHIKEDVRENVKKAAAKLGYSPQLRRSGRSVAIITPSPESIPVKGYWDMVVYALSRELVANQLRLEIIPVGNLDLLNKNQLFGAVTFVGDSNLDRHWWEDFEVPLIHLNYYQPLKDHVYAICSNEDQGIKLAVDHLRAHDHERIALIQRGPVDTREKITYRTHREEAFRKAMRKSGVPVDLDLIHYIDDNVYKQVGLILKNGVTAIICGGESHGLEMAYVLDVFNKKVPQDISLITYEWPHVSECCIPPQTTLRQNVDEVAKQAVAILTRDLDSPPAKSTIFVDYQLKLRESVVNRSD